MTVSSMNERQVAVLVSMGMALMITLLGSSAATKHFSTWLWCQVYSPWVWPVFQPTRICFRVAGAAHWDKDWMCLKFICV